MNVEKFKIGKKVKDTAGDELTYVGPSQELPGCFIFEIGGARHLYNEVGMPVTLYADELVEPEIDSLDEYFGVHDQFPLTEKYVFHGKINAYSGEHIFIFMQTTSIAYKLFALNVANRFEDKDVYAPKGVLDKESMRTLFPFLFECRMSKADFNKLFPNV